MADSYVCSGAKIRCSKGTGEAHLTVFRSPVRTVLLTGQPQANVGDHASMINVGSCGRCCSRLFPATASATAANNGRLTPMPCVPETVTDWMGGKNDYLVQGKPALLKSSKCKCQWGGTISITDDGQEPTAPSDLSRSPKDVFF